MKYRVLLQRPIPPPGHPEGAPLPEKHAIEMSEYFVTASDEKEVVRQFNDAQVSGLEHLQGRTIHSIQLVN